MFARQERNTSTPYKTYQYTIPNILNYLEEDNTKSDNINLRINPLGAGDTCSAVFTMKYVELKVEINVYYMHSSWIYIYIYI